MKTGDTEWLGKLLCDRWERIRRNPNYLRFCDANRDKFKDGEFDVFDSLTPEAEAIMKRFGLRMIYHPTVVFAENEILDAQVFPDPLAVRYEWHEEAPDSFVPIWDDHHIMLKIDIALERTEGQILSEVLEFVRQAREFQEEERKLLGLPPEGQGDKRTHLDKRREYYKIWDARKRKDSFSDIATRFGLSKTRAEKNFKTAYRLIIGKPYEPKHQEHGPILLEKLGKTCANCPDQECRNEFKDPSKWVPCPDVENYVSQDYVYQRESLTTNRHSLYSEDRDEV